MSWISSAVAECAADEPTQPRASSTVEGTRAHIGYTLHFAAALVVLTASMWLSSGSLAPLATTSHLIIYDPKCGILIGGDYTPWHATFDMLDGADRSAYEGSVVLRRILYPILAYPLMKLLGYWHGGFVTNLVLQWLAFAAFVTFLKKRVGQVAAIVAAWLLATYPGISYWAGHPYAYAIIVPACLIIAICLWEIRTSDSNRRILLLSLLMGVLFIGYDLLPFFGPAAVFILLWRRWFSIIPAAAVCLVAPFTISTVLLKAIYGVEPVTDNSAVYLVILRSYLPPYEFNPLVYENLLWSSWWTLFTNYFSSNFIYLPFAFLILALGSYRPLRLGLNAVECSVLVSGLAIWVFNNLAPPYDGWQMRGELMARLYQPMFVAMVPYCARVAQHVPTVLRDRALQQFVTVLLGLMVVANGVTVFGPISGIPDYAHIYNRFYPHSAPEMTTVNLDKYGRTPLGPCAPLTPG